MYRKICVTNRALAERPFLEQLACVLATKPYAMILREKYFPGWTFQDPPPLHLALQGPQLAILKLAGIAPLQVGKNGLGFQAWI